MATKHYDSSSQDYMTPPELYQPLLDFIGATKFDSDLACSNMNIPADKYYTLGGIFSSDDWFFKHNGTGLDGDYGDGNHFLNPPFREAQAFLKVVVRETNSNPNCHVWCILPSDRFETNYYRDLILKNPNCFMVFLPKAGFLMPQAPLEKPVPSVKVMYCYFGQDAEIVARKFHSQYGNKWAIVYNNLS